MLLHERAVTSWLALTGDGDDAQAGLWIAVLSLSLAGSCLLNGCLLNGGWGQVGQDTLGFLQQMEVLRTLK